MLAPALRLAVVSATALLLAGCNAAARMQSLGEEPALSKITDPTKAQGYQPVSWPVPNPEDAQRTAGSIWQPGARAFFKDHRATRVGDLLTVTININDQAKTQNQTQNTRNDSETSAATNLFGIETILPHGVNPASLVNGSGTLQTNGEQQITRFEQIVTTMSAMVTQVLPSGNLVIVGQQQLRVNFDVRDLRLTGIVRPTDIDATNSITYDKIAEARISYGGYGQGNDLQQPRYGTQLMDIISPF